MTDPATPVTPSYRIAAISRNVANLARAIRFYCERLGFQPAGPVHAIEERYRKLLRLDFQPVMAVHLRLGSRHIELVEVGTAGKPVSISGNRVPLTFQHFALLCCDIDAACQRLFAADDAPHATAISRTEPGGDLPSAASSAKGCSPAQHMQAVQLPAASGGARAFKFRDPDGHPLEFIELPAHAECTGGVDRSIASAIDHSAIAVANADASIEFYRRQFGFEVAARQRNLGAEQAQLDGLIQDRAEVDVVALHAKASKPHLELLDYLYPRCAAATTDSSPTDIASDRLVLRKMANPTLSPDSVAGPQSAALPAGTSLHPAGERQAAAEMQLIQDPDGHWLLVLD
ncbi:MAG: VOC family protein [Janthinobacterium lividum]